MPYTTLLRSDREMGGMRSLLDRDDVKLQVAGHETLPCRYGWLKKSYDAVCEELAVEDEQQQHAFSPNVGIGKFGVGKNMVVKRRSKGTPDRRRRGTPFSDNMMLGC